MWGSGILDTVIGLIFVFLLVSLMVTIINEMIAASFMSRAKWLRRGVERLIGSEWMQKVYDHPLIAGTGRKRTILGTNPGPSYIPSRSFANVLMSIVEQSAGAVAEHQQSLRSALSKAAVAGATLDSLTTQLFAVANEMQAKGGIQGVIAGDLIRYLRAGGGLSTRTPLSEVESKITALRNAKRPELGPLLDALTQLVIEGKNATVGAEDLRNRFDAAVANLLTGDAVKELKEELTAMGKRLQGPYTVSDAYAGIHWFIDGMSARDVRQMLEALPDSGLKTTLLTLFNDATNDVEKLKENIEVWFNNGMDRVNGWYKRKSQLVISILALVLAIVMNVDAILIFRHLQNYPAARDALVAQATQFARGNPAPVQGAFVVPNEEAFSGKLTLNAPAAADRPITLKSSNLDVTVRDNPIKVAKGATQVPFTVDVHMQSADQPGTATISSDGPSDEIKLMLTPSLLKQFDTVQKKLVDLTIPVGWLSKSTPAGNASGQVLPWEENANGVGQLLLQHALGWLLTALAATLGAPFWFDMLNRVISIRAAGKPPEEEPKPPKSVSVPVEPGQSHREADRIR